MLLFRAGSQGHAVLFQYEATKIRSLFAVTRYVRIQAQHRINLCSTLLARIIIFLRENAHGGGASPLITYKQGRFPR